VRAVWGEGKVILDQWQLCLAGWQMHGTGVERGGNIFKHARHRTQCGLGQEPTSPPLPLSCLNRR